MRRRAGRRGLRVALAAALPFSALLVSPGCHASRTPDRPVLGRVNVVLVTVDTLRADRVGPDLTPAISGLARRGVRFTDARSNVPLTLPSHASILTGLLPAHHGVRLNGVRRLKPETPTLARLLQSASYRTGAFVGAYVLDRRFGLGQGFDVYDDEIPKGEAATGSLEAERRGDVVVARAIAWLRSLPDDGRPFLLWMHLYDPHAPYTPPPEWLVRAHGQAYDGEVAFADAQVGALVDALQATGRREKTLTVVAGDHGESLGEHGEATHGMLLYEPALRVPLVLSASGLPAASRDDAATLVDIVPTVLGLLGLPTPPARDGRDLFAVGSGSTPPPVFAETQYPEAAGCSPLRSLVEGRWKLIGGPAQPELYDLGRDPAETHDLAGANPALVQAMAPRALSLAGPSSTGDAAPSAEVVERLRALGYVASAPSRSAGEVLPSPTGMVRQWTRFEEALADLNGGRSEKAAATLAALVRERPQARVFQATWARALADSGHLPQALSAYRGALRQWPEDTMLLHGLAVAARKAGRVEEAAKAEQAVLAIDPTDANAHNGMGLLLAQAGRPADARVAFERAVALDPSAVTYRVNLGNARLTAGDTAAAEEAYREALRLDSTSLDAGNGLALVLVNTGRAATAIPLLERIVALAPDFYGAWLHLGMARQATGDTAGAAEAYRRVLAAPPSAAAPREAAAQLLAGI
ncbi:MAG TPA: sulfatase-like hydrolase/transferase [Vicinamibacteria bacterium]|nr:sulfatase-like hydrolase/transferase [Vicinamibacteria bacterium]